VAGATKLPDYAPALMAHHEAFESDLRAIVASLPLGTGHRVLDIACGDGVYSRWLAERGSRVVALDRSRAFLDLAQRQMPPDVRADRVRLVRGDMKHLPFPDDCFDLVWCAQSLYSLPDPVDALRQMRRMARPGTFVAVLENDEFHHVLLPWPIEVELALRHAELVSHIERSDKPRKFYVGRQLLQIFHSAGLTECNLLSWTIDRQAPLRPKDREFFAMYLQDLRKRVKPHLAPSILDAFEPLVDPDSASYLPDSPDFAAVCINYLAWGIKPAKDSGATGRRPSVTTRKKAPRPASTDGISS
jgi:ubiquinone/menaquinone biosynthesis C-methylase UbiE